MTHYFNERESQTKPQRGNWIVWMGTQHRERSCEWRTPKGPACRLYAPGHVWQESTSALCETVASKTNQGVHRHSGSGQ